MVVDHLGNKFNNKTDMCRYWNIGISAFNGRIKRGWSLKDTLEKPIKTNYNKDKNIVDHLGNKFTSKLEMCKYWNKSECTVYSRLRRGASLREALETPESDIKYSIKVEDHKGNKFNSKKEMYTYWGINDAVFTTRSRNGWELKDILETPIGQTNPNPIKNIVDHLGNKFRTKREMYKYWNIPKTTVIARLKRGWSLKDALETPTKQ